jgi:solute carrier family 25 phosphate transporter 23/24/25/41
VGPHSITGSIRDIIHKTGWRGLWRGNGINALRGAPIQAIELSVYESVKKGLYAANKRWGVDGPPQVNVLGHVVTYPFLYASPSMIAGAVAGVVSTVSCYPLEVLKVCTSQ